MKLNSTVHSLEVRQVPLYELSVASQASLENLTTLKILFGILAPRFGMIQNDRTKKISIL